MGTSYSDFFTLAGGVNPSDSDLKKLGAALGQAFEDAGMPWVAGRAAAGWEADASGFDTSWGGTGWAVYKLRDTGGPGTTDGIFIKFTIGKRNTGDSFRNHGVRVQVSDQPDFSRKIEVATYTTGNTASNPYRAWVAFESGILTFGVDASASGASPIAFGIERTRARTAGDENDDGIFLAALGAYCRANGNFTYRYAQLDPWSTLAEDWAATTFHRASVAFGPSISGGNANCQPVYWYNGGVLEQSQCFMEVPDSVAPNATVEITNGTELVTVRSLRDPNISTPGYVWAYRFQ